MNPLIRLKAQLQCFAKALRAQPKKNTLVEISKLICCALLLTLVLRSGSACSGFTWGGWPGVSGTPTPSPGGLPETGSVQFFNCNHDNSSTGGLPGRVYNIYTRVDDGAWVERGELNIQPDPWTDCHDQAHQGSSVTVNLWEQQGKWEFRLIKLPFPSGERDCDSSAPDVANACDYLSYFYQTGEAAPVTIDVTSP
jgi:hypothetical protein